MSQFGSRTHMTIVGVMKMGNILPKAGLEPKSLAFQASLLPFHHIGFPEFTTILTPTCLCSSLPHCLCRSVQTTTYAYLHTHRHNLHTYIQRSVFQNALLSANLKMEVAIGNVKFRDHVLKRALH